MKMRLMLITILVTAGCASSKPAPDGATETAVDATEQVAEVEPEPDPIIEQGRAAMQAFYADEAESLHGRFSEEMSSALSLEMWKVVVTRTKGDLGAEVEVVEESSSTLLDNQMYFRTVKFEKVPDPLVVTWAFRSDGTISGFNIKQHREPAPSTRLDYETKTELRLPFEDEWTVIWGGRTLHQNYHAGDATQRFALDIVVTGPDNRSYSGDRTKNESYLAFGKKVLAPGAGKVIAVENGVEDNKPGEMNPAQLAGNHVFIDHGNGEFSFLAHFKKGSVTVKNGDTVKKGQLLGLCGNSGNSSEPHIHYHLQSTGEALKGEGLPIQFEAAVVDGELRNNVEVLQNQRISPPTE